MKTFNAKTGTEKKLLLKKTAVANLTISDEKMKTLMGGATTDVLTTSADVNVNTCTSTIVVPGILTRL